MVGGVDRSIIVEDPVGVVLSHFWAFPSQFLPQTGQSLSIIFRLHKDSLRDKLVVDPPLNVKETNEHCALLGRVLQCLLRTSITLADPLF